MDTPDFSLPQKLIYEITAVDCRSQHYSASIVGMANAISKLTTNPDIRAMAEHIAYLSDETMNSVNCMAESLGANYKEEKS